MKTLGIIGGISCESSAEYYLRITRKANQLLGNHQTVQIIMISINRQELINAIFNNNWNKVCKILINISRQLEQSGADCVIIPCNTLHKVANKIQKNISIPLIHLIDCVGHHLKQSFTT